MQKNNLVWGLALVLIGIIIMLNALNIININLLFTGWWTLFIIIPSLIGLIKDKDKTGSIIGLLVGVSLLLSVRGIVKIDLILKLILPSLLIIIGLSMMLKGTFTAKNKTKATTNNHYCATLSGQKISLPKEKFTGCKVDAIFGGITLDLRETIIKEDAIIEASAIFGGIDILVPENTNIVSKGTAIFGGTNIKKENDDTNKYTITINATCMFGGIDVK